jgi:FtsZ-binding cell division protein ZapB
LNLYQRNRELAQPSREQRDERWRNAVAEQARAERANARALRTLVQQGEALLRQASGNAQVDARDVQQLANSMATLEQLAGRKMPALAESLRRAAEASRSRSADEAGSESAFEEMADVESSQGVLPEGTEEEQAESAPDAAGEEASRERLGLAGTTIVETSENRDAAGQEASAEQHDADELAAAVEEQAELVAEFDSVAEQLRQLLGRMEESTMVKRLKSASRLQERVAVRTAKQIGATFGIPADEAAPRLAPAVTDVQETRRRVRTILDDLEAFCQRREIDSFQAVLQQMKAAGVLNELQRLAETLPATPGASIAAAEYWADTLDRWADDLVPPPSKSSQNDKRSSPSLSPETVLEVLRILESEVNLREQTRVAEQGRKAMEPDRYMGEAIRLSEAQDLLRDRLDVVIDGLRTSRKSAVDYESEIEVLTAASAAMVDATKTLVQPETGPPAIAAQTEAIELLLQSNKVSPESAGGGGGSASASGSGGETTQAAMALIGRGVRAVAERRVSETETVSGADRAEVPERYREGVARFFDRLEQRRLQREAPPQ